MINEFQSTLIDNQAVLTCFKHPWIFTDFTIHVSPFSSAAEHHISAARQPPQLHQQLPWVSPVAALAPLHRSLCFKLMNSMPPKLRKCRCTSLRLTCHRGRSQRERRLNQRLNYRVFKDGWSLVPGNYPQLMVRINVEGLMLSQWIWWWMHML